MISAVDTNVLLDVFLPDEKYVLSFSRLLKQAYDQGALIISDVVYSELVPQFNDRTKLEKTLSSLNITLSTLDGDAAFLAGQKWAEYRKSGGPRKRILSAVHSKSMLITWRLLAK